MPCPCGWSCDYHVICGRVLGPRVMAHDSTSGMIVVSRKSTNQLYPGYGLTKVLQWWNDPFVGRLFLSSFDVKKNHVSLSPTLPPSLLPLLPSPPPPLPPSLPSLPCYPPSLSAQISLLDMKCSEFVPVHSGVIRDVLFAPLWGWTHTHSGRGQDHETHQHAQQYCSTEVSLIACVCVYSVCVCSVCSVCV